MKKYQGDLPDNRKPQEQLKDFSSEEINLSSVVKPVTKKEAITNAKAYIKRNQYSKSSCVPSSICNALWNTEQVELADEFLYTLRANKPQEGCFWADIADKVIKFGICKRSLMPEVKTENEANAIVPTTNQYSDAENHKQLAYVYVSNHAEFVKFLNSGYSIPFSIFANSKEWSQEFPKVLDQTLTVSKAPINHAICGIQNTWYQEKGKDYFIITDSSHFGKIYLRHIDADFFNARFKHGMYFIDLSFEEPKKWITPKKYKGYKFTRDLDVGSRGQDVNDLQEILKANGYFPTNIGTTQYFGGITRQAVKEFQKAHEDNILRSIGLKLPTGYFGSSSRKEIERLLNN